MTSDNLSLDGYELKLASLAVACPRCGQAAGQTCRNVMTRQPLRAPAHFQRFVSAQKSNQDTEDVP